MNPKHRTTAGVTSEAVTTNPFKASSSSQFVSVRVVQCLRFCVVFCISLFVLLSFFFGPLYCLWRDWRYQKGNQNPYIKEKQTTQWSKEKAQKDKQRSTKHTYKTKDRVTRIPLKPWGELRCSRRLGSSCSTSDTRRVNLVTDPVISHERGKDREVFTTSGTYPWSCVTQIFHNGQPSRGACKIVSSCFNCQYGQ